MGRLKIRNAFFAFQGNESGLPLGIREKIECEEENFQF